MGLVANCYSTHTIILRLYGFCPGQPGWAYTRRTFTHSHLSWSSIVPYLLHPSNTIHGILPVQSTHPTIFFHNLSPSFLWSTSWTGTLHFILHTFLRPVIVLIVANCRSLVRLLYLHDGAVGRRACGRNKPNRGGCCGRVCALQASDEERWAWLLQLYGHQRRRLRLRRRATARSGCDLRRSPQLTTAVLTL